MNAICSRSERANRRVRERERERTNQPNWSQNERIKFAQSKCAYLFKIFTPHSFWHTYIMNGVEWKQNIFSFKFNCNSYFNSFSSILHYFQKNQFWLFAHFDLSTSTQSINYSHRRNNFFSDEMVQFHSKPPKIYLWNVCSTKTWIWRSESGLYVERDMLEQMKIETFPELHAICLRYL